MINGILEALQSCQLPGEAIGQTIFYLIAGLVVAGALLAVSLKNIFHSALGLAMALVSVAGVYLYLEAEFLAAIQVLVYVGAVVTLMVFAIMLTTDIGRSRESSWNGQPLPAALAAIVAGVLVIGATLQVARPMQAAVTRGLGETAAIGKLMLGPYAIPFEALSVVLLAALIGAVVIGAPRNPRSAVKR